MPTRPPVLTIVSIGAAAATTSLSAVVALAFVATVSRVGAGLEWMFSPLDLPLVVALWFAPLVAPAGVLLGALAVVSGVVAAGRGGRTRWPVAAAVVGGVLGLFDLVALGFIVLPLLGNAWG